MVEETLEQDIVEWKKPFVDWQPHLQHEFIKWFADTYGEASIHEHLNEFRAVKDVMASVEIIPERYLTGWQDSRGVFGSGRRVK